MDAKIPFTCEIRLSHFRQLQNQTQDDDEVYFAKLFEQAIVSYLASDTIQRSPYPKEFVSKQRKKRKDDGVRDYTTALRPSQIEMLHNVSKLQKRPQKHVIEDALSRFLGEITQFELEFEELPEAEQRQPEGVMSRLKSRIKTKPKI